MIISLILCSAVLCASIYFNYKLYSQLCDLEEYLFIKDAMREVNISIQRKIAEKSKPQAKRGRPRKAILPDVVVSNAH